IFWRSWLVKMTDVLDCLMAPDSLRSACDIRRACRPMWLSPISPSISARGTSAATESTTTTSIAPERTRASAISSACSPVSAPAGDAANAQRQVQRQRAGGYRFNVHVLGLPQPHNRAIAKAFGQVGEGLFNGIAPALIERGAGGAVDARQGASGNRRRGGDMVLRAFAFGHFVGVRRRLVLLTSGHDGFLLRNAHGNDW